MPAIVEFNGITVYIYYPPREHPPAHFHAIYGEHQASFDIETAGSLPRRQRRTVIDWAASRQAALRIPHVTELDVLEGSVLRVTFDDGLTGDVDLSSLPERGPVFEPLRDRHFFAQAYVDPKTRTVSWPDGIDLDPEGLHDEASRHRLGSRPRRLPRVMHGVLTGRHSLTSYVLKRHVRPAQS
jgi:hypothetical protein